MLEIPSAIKLAWEKIRKDYPHSSLKQINKKYYVYKQTAIWNRETHKSKVISEYLGRILNDGAFIKKEKTPSDEFDNAKAIILAHGGKVIAPTPEEEGVQTPNELTLDEIDKKILMYLSMNSRMSLTFLKREAKINLSPAAIYNRIKQLEKRLGVRYTTEINTKSLGYREFLVSIKFLGDLPTEKEMAEAFSKEPRVQLALQTKGQYDAILYVVAKLNLDLKDLIIGLREILSKYDSVWRAHPIEKDFGFIPLRDVFIDLLKEDLLNREYVVLKELNENGITEFTKIDKKYSFDSGRSQYSYHKLIEKGLLERITLSIDKIPVKYTGIIFLSKINSGEFRNNRQKILLDIMAASSLNTNKYSFVADMVNPDGIVYFLPVLKSGELEEAIKVLSFNSVKIRSVIVTNILVGSLAYRYFDQAHTLQARALVRDYKLEELKKTKYS